MKPREVKAVGTRIFELQKEIEGFKKIYNELDELIKALVEAGISEVNLQGIKLVIVDNFVGKTTIFRTTSVKRYEAKIEQKVG